MSTIYFAATLTNVSPQSDAPIVLHNPGQSFDNQRRRNVIQQLNNSYYKFVHQITRGDVLLANSFERTPHILLRCGCKKSALQALVRLTSNATWQQALKDNAVPTILHVQISGEFHNIGFTGSKNREQRTGNDCISGSHVDDETFAPNDHLGQHDPAHIRHHDDVVLDDVHVNFIFVRKAEKVLRMGIADAQGVDEDANVQTVDLLFDGVVGPQSFGNVEFDDLGFDMVDGLEVSCQVAEFFSDLGTYEHNVDADLRKHLGVGSTDPAGTAGYHTPLA